MDGLKVSRFTLVNPTPNAQSDTLVSTDQLIGVVDVGAWWKRDEIVLNELRLINGKINAYVDSLGNTNFNITPPDTTTAPVDTAESAMPFKFIDIKNVEFTNIALSYIDQNQKMQAGIQDLTVNFDGRLISDTLNMHLNISDCVLIIQLRG